MPKPSYTYIITNKKHGTLYIGVTSSLVKRVQQHKLGLMDGFAKRYGLNRLVYFEHHNDIRNAIRREKQLKEWNRAWKIRLIEKTNTNWDDLYDQLAGS